MDTVRTLVFGGGEIHDWQGIQPKLVAALEASDAFELATAQEDLDALLDLDAYDVLVFHYTVGTISDAQRDALSSWLMGGKGYVGIHSAADSFRDDPAYRNMVGGHFITHRASISVGVGIVFRISKVSSEIGGRWSAILDSCL